MSGRTPQQDAITVLNHNGYDTTLYPDFHHAHTLVVRKGARIVTTLQISDRHVDAECVEYLCVDAQQDEERYRG